METAAADPKFVVEVNFLWKMFAVLNSGTARWARQLFLRSVSHKQFIATYPALTLLVLVGHAAIESRPRQVLDVAVQPALGGPRLDQGETGLGIVEVLKAALEADDEPGLGHCATD